MQIPFESVHSPNLNDFVGLIKSDHRRLEDLMRRAAIYKTKANRLQFTEKLAQEVVAHLKAEEELAFPIIEKKEAQRVQKVASENEVILKLARELAAAAEKPITLQAKLQLLRTMFRHHIKDVELKLLPLLNNGDTDPIELGYRYLSHKQLSKNHSVA